jgi:hypothetical protein
MTKQAGKLSEQMERVLREIEPGGVAVATGGGAWATVDGKDLGFNITQTIYSLEKRGLVERTHTDHRYWRDTRKVTEAARAALKGAPHG